MPDVCKSTILSLLNATQPSTAVPTNQWLRDLRAGQGLLAGLPIEWPANVSFLQVISELGIVHKTGFAVEIGAGDGKRLDGYHRPLDPVWPLFESGFGGLAIEANHVFNHQHTATPDDEPSMTYASGKLSTSLASANASGNLRIAWARATPSNVAQKLIDGVASRLVTGVNLPMLLRSLSYRHEPLEALVARAVTGGTQGVMQVAVTAPQNQARPQHDPKHYDHQQ